MLKKILLKIWDFLLMAQNILPILIFLVTFQEWSLEFFSFKMLNFQAKAFLMVGQKIVKWDRKKN